MSYTKNLACGFLLLVFATIFFPDNAFAQIATLRCDEGLPVDNTWLFGEVKCDPKDFQYSNVFSYLNCAFQAILNDVIGQMYCGIQFRLEHVLNAAIILYIVIYAISFSFGIAELTARELVVRLIKIALVWSFAMNASWGISLAFYFFIGTIETVSMWMINVIFPGTNAPNFFYALDRILFNHASSSFTVYGATLVAFFISLWYALTPIFLLFLYFMITLMKILMRTLVTYLLSLAMISFLIALSPIFVSMALFQITYQFFETWLRYMISMALQVIIMFSAVAVWLYTMSLLGDFFANLVSIIRPYSKELAIGAPRMQVDPFGVCNFNIFWEANQVGPRASCITGPRASVIPPTSFVQSNALIFYLTLNLLVLSVVVYAFDTLIKQIPDIAHNLAGPQYVPKIIGGDGQGSLQYPGFSLFGKAKSAVSSSLEKSFSSSDNFKKATGDMVGKRRTPGDGG